MNMNELSLNKNYYSREHIIAAVTAFAGLCRVELSENEDYYVCVFSNCVYDVDVTKKEFENYLIDLINTSHDGI